MHMWLSVTYLHTRSHFALNVSIEELRIPSVSHPRRPEQNSPICLTLTR